MIFWELLSGWKMVLGYLIANIPFLVNHPVLVQAIELVRNNPSFANIVNLVAQVLLVVGLVDRIRKNVSGKSGDN